MAAADRCPLRRRTAASSRGPRWPGSGCWSWCWRPPAGHPRRCSRCSAGALVAGLIAWRLGASPLWIGLGAAYLALPALALIWLRGLPQLGLQIVVWLLVVVWTTDILAYLVGRNVGGPRLAPSISPGKTWSGLCGGVLAAALAGAVTAWAIGSERLLHAAGLGGLLAIVSQIGDLIESALKRRAGVKDSGTLIPGHGGVLDRLDGLILAAPVLALLGLVVRPEDPAVAVALSPDRQRSVTILGATGSVGQSTLNLIGLEPDRYRIEALTAHRNVEALARDALRHRARLAVIGDPGGYPALCEALAGSGIEAACGEAGLIEAAARPADWVMAAIVGAAGLGPTLTAIRRGAMVALATKECLVCAGALLMDEVRRSGAILLPVELRAQCDLPGAAGRDHGYRGAPHPDRLGRAVSRALARGHGRGDAARGDRASQLGHGRQDLGRFRRP